jgi:hypothetical protein
LVSVLLAVACGGAGVDDVTTSSAPAEPRTPPASPTGPKPAPVPLPVTSITVGVDGRTLTLHTTTSPPDKGPWAPLPIATGEVGLDEVRVTLLVGWEWPYARGDRADVPGDDEGIPMPLPHPSAQLTLAEPFGGRVVVDATSGRRFPLAPPELVDLGPLLPGWRLDEQWIRDDDPDGLTWGRVYAHDAAPTPPAGPQLALLQYIDHEVAPPEAGPGDELVALDLVGVPAVLVRSTGNPSSPGYFVLQWRPGRNGLLVVASAGDPPLLAEQDVVALGRAVVAQLRPGAAGTGG